MLNRIDLSHQELERLRLAMRKDREEGDKALEGGRSAYLRIPSNFQCAAAEILVEHSVTDFVPGSMLVTVPAYALIFNRLSPEETQQ